MRLFIYAWNRGSKSARALAEGLDALRIQHEGSRFRGSQRKTVINWGSSTYPVEVAISNVINTAEAVRTASHKLAFFECMSEEGQDNPRLPEWTTDPLVALDWMETSEVLARTMLQAHSGEGIQFLSEGFVDAPLYTKYKKKISEFRVHFFRGEVLDVQQKKLRTLDDGGVPINPDNVDFRIRNHANGFIFAREDIRVPDDVVEQARKAFVLSGLDFGAVDVIWNNHENQAYVLEINTAPGLEGQTLTNYVAAFRAALS